jgi:hypothetical protein
MTVLHEKGSAVLFGSDGIIGGDLERLYVFDAELISAGRPLFLPDRAPDDHRRLLGQRIELMEKGMVLVGAEEGGLDDARPVPDKEKTDFATRAFVIDPAPDLDVLLDMTTDIFDIHPLHGVLIIGKRWSTVK